MSFFVPSGVKTPGSKNLQSLTITENCIIKTLSDGVSTLENGYLTGLNDPIIPSGAATKQYVDNSISDLVWRSPCRLATTSDNVDITLHGNQIIDNVLTLTGDRVLVKNQTGGILNGYYNSNAGNWSRTFDMEDGFKVTGFVTVVSEGDDNSDMPFLCSNNTNNDEVGTDSLNFITFNGQNIAGAGLSQIGSVVNVNTDGTSISINGINNLQIVNTTVSPNTYGTSLKIPSLTVNSKGQLTNCSELDIQHASLINEGIVTTSSQTFSGVKTFSDGISSSVLSGLSTPLGNTDAVNKLYVDSVAAGINWTTPALVLATDPIDLVTGGFLTIDSVILTTNDRVLIIGGSTSNPNILSKSIDNGLYQVKSGSWIRTVDMPIGLEVSGYATFIISGSVNANTGYICANSSPDEIVGTNSLQFVQFAGFQEITAGTGLTKSGNMLNVNVDNVGIELSSNNLQLKDGGVTSSKLANTTVVAGTYGSSSQIPAFTVDSKGRLTGVNNVTITTGDVNGPVSSTNNSLVRFNGITGKIIKDSPLLVSDDSGNLTSSGIITISSGSNAAPSYSFTGTTDTGMYSSGAGVINFTTSGTSKLSIGTNISSTISTATTSNTTGSLTLTGGVGISNTTDATSVTNGGTITTAGGVSIAKKLFVGTTVNLPDSASTPSLVASTTTTGIGISSNTLSIYSNGLARIAFNQNGFMSVSAVTLFNERFATSSKTTAIQTIGPTNPVTIGNQSGMITTVSLSNAPGASISFNVSGAGINPNAITVFLITPLTYIGTAGGIPYITVTATTLIPGSGTVTINILNIGSVALDNVVRFHYCSM